MLPAQYNHNAQPIEATPVHVDMSLTILQCLRRSTKTSDTCICDLVCCIQTQAYMWKPEFNDMTYVLRCYLFRTLERLNICQSPGRCHIQACRHCSMNLPP